VAKDSASDKEVRMLLSGRKALVTGGSSGIGKATAERLAREGASVCVNYYSDRERADAETLVGELKKLGAGHSLAVQADVGDEAQVTALVARASAALGGIDLLVNNAGIEKQVRLIDMTLDDWNAVIRTNLSGAFLCMREATKEMLEKGGVVVNISSVHEFIPWPGFAHYCASKSGMKLLMETAARELAPNKIRVVNVAPGAIVTPINKFVLDDPEAEHAVRSEIPIGRMGKADEVAAAVAWLASDEASYITGTTVVVDGGMSLYPKFV
jgi:glucose 1-dehydrogenase